MNITYKVYLGNGMFGSQEMDTETYDQYKNSGEFPFNPAHDLLNKYDSGKFNLSDVETYEGDGRQTDFFVRDFQLRERNTGNWVSYINDIQFKY